MFPVNRYFGLGLVSMGQVWRKYMKIKYLDPWGNVQGFYSLTPVSNPSFHLIFHVLFHSNLHYNLRPMWTQIIKRMFPSTLTLKQTPSQIRKLKLSCFAMCGGRVGGSRNKGYVLGFPIIRGIVFWGLYIYIYIYIYR